MPGYILHQHPAIASCPHGGQVSVITMNQNVRILGQPVATFHDKSLVAGCSFTVPGPKAQPCVQVKWEAAKRVKVNNQPAILQTSSAQCYSAENAIQGFALGYAGQTKVYGA